MKDVLIEVSELTRMKIKEQAKLRGMTMKGYVNYIADQDKKLIMKGK